MIHDWGSALGFDWAYRHQNHVKGIVYMEAVLFHYNWSDWPDDARKIFQGFRSPVGEKLILDKNYFIELVLPNSVIRELTPSEMDAYRRPFLNPGEDRRPMLTWPRQIPIEGCALQAHEIQLPEMAASAKLNQQLRTESCVVPGNGYCEA